MYIKVHGPDHISSRHLDTSFPLPFLRAGPNGNRWGQKYTSSLLWKWWGGQQTQRVGWQEESGTWGLVTDSVSQACKFSSVPGCMEAAGWHLFAMLTAWKDCKLRNCPLPMSHTSPLPRLFQAWCPAGEMRCWVHQNSCPPRSTRKGRSRQSYDQMAGRQASKTDCRQLPTCWRPAMPTRPHWSIGQDSGAGHLPTSLARTGPTPKCATKDGFLILCISTSALRDHAISPWRVSYPCLPKREPSSLTHHEVDGPDN